MPKRTSKYDSGITLVELLVSISLGLIVLALLATMMIGVYGTQDRVSKSSNAATQAQVGSDVFRTAIRSSTGTKLSAVTVDGSPGQLLVTRTLDSSNPGSLDPSARCIGFLWKSVTEAPGVGAIYWATSSSSSTLPLSSSSSGWADLITGISPLPAATGTSLLPAVFAIQTYKYTMSFITAQGSGPKTTIKVSASSPVLDEEVSGGCY